MLQLANTSQSSVEQLRNQAQLIVIELCLAGGISQSVSRKLIGRDWDHSAGIFRLDYKIMSDFRAMFLAMIQYYHTV